MLDTNIAVLFLSGDQLVQKRLAEAQRVILSTVVLGELHYGAHRSVHVVENIGRIERFAEGCEIADVTAETAKHYGIIKSALRRQGTPIPDNDIWIAALAKQYDATVATRDAHFETIEQLTVERW